MGEGPWWELERGDYREHLYWLAQCEHHLYQKVLEHKIGYNELPRGNHVQADQPGDTDS